MNEQVWWYLARSSGIVALVLLLLSLVWGILLATRVLRPVDRPVWLLDLHRWFGSLAVVMTALHLLGLVLDSYVEFGVAEILVPGASSYRPMAVAFGVVAMYALVAVQLSSVFRRHLPRLLWQRIHLLSYLMLWASAMHAGLAGSDTGSPAYAVLALALTIAGVGAVLVRILVPGKRSPNRTAEPAGAVAR